MIRAEAIVVLVCFHDAAPPHASASAARRLGLTEGLDRRCRWHGEQLLSIQLDRPAEASALAELSGLPGIREIRVVPAEGGLTSMKGASGRSLVRLPNREVIGGGTLAVIAGPCSVESAAQICEIAARVREAGASALRGGAFKPRSSPYAFAGLGEKALEHLALAREKTGLPVVTEVLESADIDLVARYADMIQIGARNMHNFPLLFKAGSHRSGKPILLKRGLSATIAEFLQAAEHVLLGRLSVGLDEPRLILCERGIRTGNDSTRFTLDVGAIAVLRERTHLPVIADPSHAAGDRRHVAPLALAAAAAGADGLMIEVHPQPSEAWSDGPQCIDPAGFQELMNDLRLLKVPDAGSRPRAIRRRG
ncbi:MAG: 3-deoxy-7-phosphoheptulonate synthase [Elusimicrobia bacterium RIFOXYD12_FULL_66_9]|nr:MAG: 3-deoxy-7-phosphoheptulonate synthase [Elusimicrobia bacterium RIFOXYD12_FULL_66_9]